MTNTAFAISNVNTLTSRRQSDMFTAKVWGRCRVSGSPSSVTELLAKWEAGDEEALKRLLPLLYHELHRLAAVLSAT
jgi:hypothetical protein